MKARALREAIGDVEAALKHGTGWEDPMKLEARLKKLKDELSEVDKAYADLRKGGSQETIFVVERSACGQNVTITEKILGENKKVVSKTSYDVDWDDISEIFPDLEAGQVLGKTSKGNAIDTIVRTPKPKGLPVAAGAGATGPAHGATQKD